MNDGIINDIFGVNVAAERFVEQAERFREISEAIQMLRALDLTDVHPAVVFDPLAGYHQEAPR